MNRSKEEILNSIDKLITVKAGNTWSNHFKYFARYFGNPYNENIQGQTNHDSFIIWQYNDFWGGIFYPIIFGYFDSGHDIEILKLRTKLNIIGKLLSLIVFIGILLIYIHDCYYILDGNIHLDFKEILITLMIAVVFQTVPVVAYRYTRRQSINFLKDYLSKDHSTDENL
jgi:hypothetical protein